MIIALLLLPLISLLYLGMPYCSYSWWWSAYSLYRICLIWLLTLTAKSALLLLVVLLRLGLTGRTDNWVKVNRKIEAASSFFLYTFFGSLLLFIALLVLYSETGHLSYEMVLSAPLTLNRQKLLWLAFFLSLAIKIPLLPFHLWLYSYCY